MPIDLNILSLSRLNGKEQDSLPGLMAFAPPRRAARGRTRESLLVSLSLSGNMPFTAEEYENLVKHAAATYHGTTGALTAALRAAAGSINDALLERNLSASGRGQYVIGSLTLASLRESQVIILQCGPTHVLSLNGGRSVHLHDPALSGKGLGISQSISHFYSQITLQPGDRLLFCPKLPPAWENVLASDRGLPTLESTRKRMLSMVEGDVNGALVQVTEGTGRINLGDGTPSAPQPMPSVQVPVVLPPVPVIEEAAPVEAVRMAREEQPSAYAIPPQPEPASEEMVEQLAVAAMTRQFPPSIPRALPPEPVQEPVVAAEDEEPVEFERVDITTQPVRSPEEIARRRAERKRKAARFAVNGLQSWRNLTTRGWARIRKFLPNLVPGGESDLSLPLPAMAFISILIPLLVVTIAVVVYMRFGRSSQYETYIAQAQVFREQALGESDPVRQREAWSNVLQRAVQAETYNITGDTIAIRQEAQGRLDALLGITRLDYNPVFGTGINAEISRMAASDSDLFMLDATQGSILRAVIGRSYELDVTFDCKPGVNGSNTVGSLVDLLVLPKVNTLNSSVMGVDAMGNLLYCAPGKVSKAIALTPPNTNWGRVTAMALDSGKLYVLDAPSRAVWIYTENEGIFKDPPLIFFGVQIPDIQDAIDIAVNGDELYLLHADGRITYCMYSRLDGVPTRCDSPVTLVNRLPAYGETNVFAQAHFTQMMLAELPESTVILLDAEGQSMYRLSSRGFELQGILGAAIGDLPAGSLGAMTAGPNHILYVVLDNQVYVANYVP